MPRTKRIYKKSENVKLSNTKLDLDVNAHMKALDTKMAVTEMEVQALTNQALLSIDSLLNEYSLKFRQYGNMTMGELQNTKPKEMTTLYEQSMKAINASKVRGRKRSSSVVNKGANLQSTAKTVRSSRSLSRSKKLLSDRSHIITPMNRQPPPSYGMITPKVVPNAPQVVLRRPKQGELAVSMQGSPLMVDHISHEKASVNIPLDDGRVFCIQPERGIRPSLIPDIDPELINQIQTLRDNLSTVLSNK